MTTTVSVLADSFVCDQKAHLTSKSRGCESMPFSATTPITIVRDAEVEGEARPPAGCVLQVVDELNFTVSHSRTTVWSPDPVLCIC
jgi:hypothetical protein